jgi:hypothetical protein
MLNFKASVLICVGVLIKLKAYCFCTAQLLPGAAEEKSGMQIKLSMSLIGSS